MSTSNQQSFLERITTLESVVKLVREELEIIAGEMRNAGTQSDAAASLKAASLTVGPATPSLKKGEASAGRSRGQRG